MLAEPLQRLLMRQRPDLANEGAERPPELERAAGAVAVPERHLGRHAGRRGDRHPLERHILDSPRRRPQHEGVAGTALVHHLLVELADPRAVGEEHAEQAAIGDGAAARDRQPLGAVAGAERVVDAVPDDPRPELGELLARIAAGEQVEHVAEQLVGQLAEVGAATHQRRQIGHGALTASRRVSDDLLGEHVERVAEVARVLDLAVDHAPRHDRRLDEIAAVLRKDHALARLPDRVSGAADALQAAADRARRLDLDDEIDGSHVDAELERGGGDDRPQLAALELILDDHALLAGQRSVVGPEQLGVGRAVLLLVELVQLGGETLGRAAGVAEDDRRAVGEHELEHPGIDARPDARPALAAAGLADRHRALAR